jgi:hypothetical protein
MGNLVSNGIASRLDQYGFNEHTASSGGGRICLPSGIERGDRNVTEFSTKSRKG